MRSTIATFASIALIASGCTGSVGSVGDGAITNHQPPSDAVDDRSVPDATVQDDVLDLTDIRYASDVPDVQWGPRDASGIDADCPYLYAIHIDFDAGAIVRDRLILCSERTHGWTDPFEVCCRREFIDDDKLLQPQQADPSWPVRCVARVDCRLGGRLP